jgi:FkbM family methyltransferase
MFEMFKSFLFRELQRRGYCISYGEPATFDGILASFGGRREEFHFIQVGAYDGRESDPICEFVRRYRWAGLLVEPQPDVFEKLKLNYAGLPRLKFERAAIVNEEGPFTLYRLKNEYAHLFHTAHRTLSSFDPEHIIRHLSRTVDPEKALERVETECLTFSGLVEKHHISRIDLLQIDAEGYDYEIIKSINFARLAPRIIRFEHANLTGSAKLDCFDLLLSKSYKLVVGIYDTTAFQSRWMYA